MSKKTISELPVKELLPGFKGRMVHTEKLTIAYWEIREGSELPLHSHFHEQCTEVVEGCLELTVDGKQMILNAGDMVVIPPHAQHGGLAVTDCRVTDIFCPVREEYK